MLVSSGSGCELSTWTAGLPLVLEERYCADGHTGDQNEYFVYRAR